MLVLLSQGDLSDAQYFKDNREARDQVVEAVAPDLLGIPVIQGSHQRL
jgi:hypothetical protein